MRSPPARTERRKLNLRDTQVWARDSTGDVVCPWCAALVYFDRADFHQERCAAAQPERRVLRSRSAEA